MRGVNAGTKFSVDLVKGAATLVAVDNFEELRMMIDEYDEMIARYAAIDAELMRLGQPAPGMFTLAQIMSNPTDYPTTDHDQEFYWEKDIETYFAGRIFHVALMREQHKTEYYARQLSRIRHDWNCALADIKRRREAWESFEVRPEVAALEKQAEALFDNAYDLKSAICDLPCRSLRDVQIKAELASRWFKDQAEHAFEFVAILKSINIIDTGTGSASPRNMHAAAAG